MESFHLGKENLQRNSVKRKLEFTGLTIIFAQQFSDMETQKDYREQDFAHNWVHSSTFLFYLQVFCIVALIIGGSYSLYKHRYKGKPEVAVPENTLYTPKYK